MSLDLLEQEKKAVEALEAIRQRIAAEGDKIKKLQKLGEELEALKEKYGLDKDQFIDTFAMFFKKEPVMVWVKVDGKAVKWPKSRRGKPSPEIAAIIGKKSYAEFIKANSLTDAEAEKLNAQ